MYFIRSYIYILNKGRCKPNGNLICRPNIDTNGTVKRTHSPDILVPALHRNTGTVNETTLLNIGGDKPPRDFVTAERVIRDSFPRRRTLRLKSCRARRVFVTKRYPVSVRHSETELGTSHLSSAVARVRFVYDERKPSAQRSDYVSVFLYYTQQVEDGFGPNVVFHFCVVYTNTHTHTRGPMFIDHEEENRLYFRSNLFTYPARKQRSRGTR